LADHQLKKKTFFMMASSCDEHSLLFQLLDHLYKHELREDQVFDIILAMSPEQKEAFLIDSIVWAPEHLKLAFA